ncbi:MAG: sugar MFS transporter [Puniceicoccales bacterium]|jgi:fucose permease|nr:sugar MFS transporter [Puniceicoccales bacterium]
MHTETKPISADAAAPVAGQPTSAVPGGRTPLIARGFLLTFVMVTSLFFLWAFPNTFNDVLIKQFIKSLELSEGQTGFLPFALKTGYFFLAIPAGLFMQRWGYKNGILAGLVLFAAGCFLFYPAAHSREFSIFLGGIFVMAGGCAFLEIGANSFVVNLGHKDTSERRLNLAQSFNPIGGITAAALGTVFIFSGIEPKDHTVAIWKNTPAVEVYQAVQASGGAANAKAYFTEEFFKEHPRLGTKNLSPVGDPSKKIEAVPVPIGDKLDAELTAWGQFFGRERTPEELARWRSAGNGRGATAYEAFVEAENLRVFPTYVTLGALVVLMALVMWRAPFPEIAAPAKGSSDPGAPKGSFRGLLRYPHWWGAIVSQFFYLGAQLGTWSFLINYVKDNTGLGEKQAGAILVVNMVVFMVGRFLSTYLMKFVRPQRLMGAYACINITLVSVAILGSKWAAVRYGSPLHGWAVSLPFGLLDEPLPVGIFALVATTLFMSLMYPTNFASGMKGLGPNAKLGASILVMSLIGGAVLSAVMGVIWGSQWAQLPHGAKAVAPALVVPIVSYCVIAWYAFLGSRPRGPIYD